METLRCCEVYTPKSCNSMAIPAAGEGKWRPIAPLQVPRSGSRVVALEPTACEPAGRYLAAVGGCDDIFGRAETQPSVELFDSMVGHWFLLPRHLEQPRTTAAVVAVSSRRLLVVGGAPSLHSAEMFQIPNQIVDEAEATVNEHVADMEEGRMGCQAALLNLPGKNAAYPLSNTRCVAIVGGERCQNEGSEDWQRSKQFATVPVYDLTLGTWRENVIPPMKTERTAVAICVGVGSVTARS